MVNKEIITVVKVYESIEELTIEDRNLINSANEAVERAYAPYSNFHVGASVVLKNGKVFTGTNQENAAYPSGLCAERVALFYANSEYPDVAVETMAISVKNKNGFVEYPVAPCGSCRQVLLESEVRFNQDIRIILAGTKAIRIIENSKQLLPLHFQKDDLDK